MPLPHKEEASPLRRAKREREDGRAVADSLVYIYLVSLFSVFRGSCHLISF